MNRDKKIILLAATVVAGVVGTLVVLPPVRQDPTYHRFADQRTWAGIPHAGDVLSNLSFVIVALLGLAALFMYARRDHGTARIWTTPYTAFFIGIALIGAGSSYYHWAPDNAALVWDRLPMTLTFMSLFCVGHRRSHGSYDWQRVIRALAANWVRVRRILEFHRRSSGLWPRSIHAGHLAAASVLDVFRRTADFAGRILEASLASTVWRRFWSTTIMKYGTCWATPLVATP